MDATIAERWLFVPAAGPRAGLGHLRRCAALEAWAPAAIGFAEGALLPTEERRRQLATAIVDQQVQWIILDGYDFTTDDQRAIQATGRQLLVIDDDHHLDKYHADLIVNPNCGAERVIYRGSPLGRRLLGTDYALIRPDVLDQRRQMREVPRVATRVLVTTGGGNPGQVRERIVAALERVDTERLDITVVVGPHDESTVFNPPVDSRHRWTVASNPENLPQLMNEAHLVISTAGITLAELACLGVPTLAVVAAENQRGGAEAFDRADAVELAERAESLDIDKFARQIERLIADPMRRRVLSENGLRLIDGHGAQRIVRAMRDLTIRLRPAEIDDLQLLFEWANDPLVRQVSFQSEPIDLATHTRWFQQRLNDPQCTIYVAHDGDHQPLGQARFERRGDEAAISASIAATQRGKHRGPRMIHLACRRYFHEHDVKVIVARIKPDNEASLRAFRKVGFQFDRETRIDEQPATEWRLRRDAWT